MKYLFAVFFACPLLVFAQTTPTAVLKGLVTDYTGETLIGASIKVWRGDTIVRGGITDLEGEYRILLEPGTYDVECHYTGFAARRFTDVLVGHAENVLKFEMESGVIIEGIHSGCSFYWPPLINVEPGNVGTTFSSYQLEGRH